ncbi:hypothetical protein M3E13_15460 [Oceanobacillus kimchii]|uniref:hypothetical protein n=1 Tax=Oceanobacillus kimchii TaxID=746691 RepID=UPI0021A7EFE1|nr:hypothetical protein [Oceanobacillus kimchii]MCT1575662.1 hypothetical protein [Oceanobacillus kimchii]MCT2137293.1 hypothetical protein [Oceanobacillus kimchii]
MNLDRSLEIFEVVTKAFDEGFISFNSYRLTGKEIHLSNKKFMELSEGHDVFVVEDYNKHSERHNFEYRDCVFFTLIKKEPVASNPYGLTEQERDMRNAGHKESDFFE